MYSSLRPGHRAIPRCLFHSGSPICSSLWIYGSPEPRRVSQQQPQCRKGRLGVLLIVILTIRHRLSILTSGSENRIWSEAYAQSGHCPWEFWDCTSLPPPHLDTCAQFFQTNILINADGSTCVAGLRAASVPSVVSRVDVDGFFFSFLV